VKDGIQPCSVGLNHVVECRPGGRSLSTIELNVFGGRAQGRPTSGDGGGECSRLWAGLTAVVRFLRQ
jgi:hypothetical protein